jgi:hypothetical protein
LTDIPKLGRGAHAFPAPPPPKSLNGDYFIENLRKTTLRDVNSPNLEEEGLKTFFVATFGLQSILEETTTWRFLHPLQFRGLIISWNQCSNKSYSNLKDSACMSVVFLPNTYSNTQL